MDARVQMLGRVGQRHPALRLLVLLGSRATGQARADSDWDLGFLADNGLDAAGLIVDVTDAVETDAVDVVDLAHASAVLRRDAGAGGRCLYQREDGAFLDFRIEAATFWCDVEPVLREAHRSVLLAAKR